MNQKENSMKVSRACRRLPKTYIEIPIEWEVYQMKIMTIVKGQVPVERRASFEVAYRSIRENSLPPELKMSFLTRGTDDSGTYVIETVWSSQDALDAMRATTKPRAIALFEEIGVSPKVEIHEIVGSVP
jgi:quinol monooxygenase YgiN